MGEFEKLYRRYVEAVFRFSWHCVGRREIAEEITSEAFVALFESLDRIDESQLPAWLFTVARNRAVDYWRRSALEHRYLSGLRETVADPELPLENWLLQNKALKPAHRVCLILRYVQGMGRAEIARQTGFSENQIKGYLQYALQLLRKELRATFGEG